jgi:predicted transcriptional regulator
MLKTTVKRHFGSLEAVAQALGITKSAVSQWPDRVPEGAAYKLQFITGGKLRVEQAMYRVRRSKIYERAQQ